MADKIVKRGISIFIDGKEVENSVKSIRSEMAKLRNEQAKTIVGSEEYVKKGKQIAQLNTIYESHIQQQKKVNAELAKQAGLTKQTGSAWSRLADGFNKYGALAASFLAGITGISFAFRKLAENIAHMDDVYSDVMKTTGATREEVEELNEVFKKLDTRTSREELNKEAETLGRLGVSMRDIPKATEAVDKAVVALGDSFGGGTEAIVTALGKINTLYTQTREMEIDKSFMAIGSAMNELAANGASSEQNISEFAIRVGAMQESLKPAIADVLGLGAAFEESGIDAEIASRAYGIVLNRATTDTESFAKVMGKSKAEIEALINANPLEFFLQFAEAMKGMNAVDTARTLDKLRINAEGANKILGAAGNNIERFREMLKLSNEAFAESTSLQNEFAIKNNNLQAKMEKARKQFAETSLELGKKLYPMLIQSTNGVTYLIKALVQMPKWINENKGLIATLAITLGTYTIAINRARIATLLMKTANGDLRRSFLNMLPKMNPYVLIGAGIAAITTVIYKFATRMSEAKRAVGEFATESTKATTEANNLFNALKNTNLKQEQRATIMKTINERYGDYLPNLLNEKSTLWDIEKAQQAVNKALRQKIAIEVRDSALAKVVQKNSGKLESSSGRLQKELSKRLGESSGAMAFGEIQGIFSKNGDDFDKGYSEAAKYMNALKVMGWDAHEALIEYRKVLQNIRAEQGSIELTFKGLVGDETAITALQSTVNSNNNNETNLNKTTTTESNEQKKEKAYRQALDERTMAYVKYLNEQKELRNRAEIDEDTYEERLKSKSIELLEEQLKITEEYCGKESEEYNEMMSRKLDAQYDFSKFAEKQAKDAGRRQLNALQKQTDESVRALEEQRDRELRVIERQANRGEINEKEYQRKRYEITNQYNMLILTARSIMEKAVRKLIDEGVSIDIEALDKISEEVKKLMEEIRKEQEDFADSQVKTIEDIISSIKNIDYGDIGNGLRNAFVRAFESINELKENSKAGFADWGAAVFGIMADTIGAVGSLVQQAHEAETASLEAEKNQQLAIAGNNTTRREQIEKQYARKELELKKKQASANAGIQLAQTLVAGALAVAQSFAQLGPIGGAIAAVLVGAMTAAQVALIVKQQKAIESQQAQFYTGGFTPKVGKYQAVGVVHGNEYVIPSEGINNPEVLPIVNMIETARREGRLTRLKREELMTAFGNKNSAGAVQVATTTKNAETDNTTKLLIATIADMSATVVRLRERLDQGIEAYSVVAGKNGSYEKTKEYEQIIKNSHK